MTLAFGWPQWIIDATEWTRTHIPPWVFIAIIAHFTVLGTVAYLILLERKIASWVQDRIGPNRVGPAGLLQPIADGLKFILKEDYRPKGVDRWLFTIAPALMILVIIISSAVLPWGGTRQNTRDIDVTGAADARAAAIDRVPGTVIDIRIDEQPAQMRDDEVRVPAKTTAHVTYRYPFQIAKL